MTYALTLLDCFASFTCSGKHFKTFPVPSANIPSRICPKLLSLHLINNRCSVGKKITVFAELKMNFEKWLRLLQQQTLTEWRGHYLCYKLLKKHIKLTASAAAAADNNNNNNSTRAEDEDRLKRFEAGFIHLLNPEILKINKFMEMKIKECRARLQVLKDRIEKMKNTSGSSKEYNKKEVVILGKDLVNLYGELVLLENYSVWNYTGIRKIVKKYNRHMRGVLGEHYSIWVKCEPCSEATGSLSKLLTECQSIVNSLLFSSLFGESMKEFVMGEILEEQSVYRSSVAALEILNEMMTIDHAYDSDSS